MLESISASNIRSCRVNITHFPGINMKPTHKLVSLCFPVCPTFMPLFNTWQVHIFVSVCPLGVHVALTSLTQLLMSVLWWALGKVSNSSSWTLSASQQPLFISVTRMSATPPEPARISQGVEFPMPLYILCKRRKKMLSVDSHIVQIMLQSSISSFITMFMQNNLWTGFFWSNR